VKNNLEFKNNKFNIMKVSAEKKDRKIILREERHIKINTKL